MTTIKDQRILPGVVKSHKMIGKPAWIIRDGKVVECRIKDVSITLTGYRSSSGVLANGTEEPQVASVVIYNDSPSNVGGVEVETRGIPVFLKSRDAEIYSDNVTKSQINHLRGMVGKYETELKALSENYYD